MNRFEIICAESAYELEKKVQAALDGA